MNDPFRELDEMRKRMEKMFGESPRFGFSNFQTPEIDVINDPKEIKVIAELPGVNKENIELNAEPKTLEIKADTKQSTEKGKEGYYYRERSNKSYRRRIELPEEVKPEETEATYNNGVLEITLPKATAEKKGKHINIK